MPEKFDESIEKAKKALQTADHIAYITFPLVKDKRLLLKTVDELYNVMLNIVNAILQYEYLYKRINLYKDPQENFRIFREKCALRFSLTSDELGSIVNIFKLAMQHKQSPFEFMQREKVVIMSNNLHTETITLEQIKKYLTNAKSLLLKANAKIKSRA